MDPDGSRPCGSPTGTKMGTWGPSPRGSRRSARRLGHRSSGLTRRTGGRSLAVAVQTNIRFSNNCGASQSYRRAKGLRPLSGWFWVPFARRLLAETTPCKVSSRHCPRVFSRQRAAEPASLIAEARDWRSLENVLLGNSRCRETAPLATAAKHKPTRLLRACLTNCSWAVLGNVVARARY